MNKPSKPSTEETKVFDLVYSYTGKLQKPSFLPQEEVEAHNQKAVDEDGNCTEDSLWETDSVSLDELRRAIDALPPGFSWELCSHSLEGGSSSLSFSGTRQRTEKEMQEANNQYQEDLKAYEKWKEDEKLKKQAKALANKKKKLDALKKELGDQ